MNRDAYEAARDCATRDYIREKRIDYVVDSVGQFLISACGLSLDHDLTRVTELPSGTSPIVVARPKSD